MLINQNYKLIISIILSLSIVLILKINNESFNVFFIFFLFLFFFIITSFIGRIPFKQNKSKKIPKRIYLTYFDKKRIPKKVWKKLKFYGKGYKILFFSDNDCINYLDKNFGNNFATKFKEIKLGAHKADFFRYCILLNEGGIYLDIDLEPKEKFDKIFNHNEEKIFYTVISNTKLQSKDHKISKFKKIFRRFSGKSEKTIFQAMIATYPNNPIFIKLIKDFWNINNLHLKHDIITIKFYYRLKDIIIKQLKEGTFNTKNNDKLILFSERNKKLNNNERPDRTGSYPKIFNKKKILFHSRYSDYPW